MGHKKVTSKRIASKAAKTLANPKSSKKEKSLAGSALSQSRGKHQKKGKSYIPFSAAGGGKKGTKGGRGK